MGDHPLNGYPYPHLLSLLTPYATSSEINALGAMLLRRPWATIPVQQHVIKVRTDGDPSHLRSLRTEARFYESTDHIPLTLPTLCATYFVDHAGALVLQRLKGDPLSVHREALGISVCAQRQVLDVILRLQSATPPPWLSTYDRNDKYAKYLAMATTAGCIDADALHSLSAFVGLLGYPGSLVMSHGDLNPTNILGAPDGAFYILDWEYISLRPPSHDPLTFLLFANEPLTAVADLERLAPYWEPLELYRDALVICMRQVRNWATQTTDRALQRQRIPRWRDAALLAAAILHERA